MVVSCLPLPIKQSTWKDHSRSGSHCHGVPNSHKTTSGSGRRLLVIGNVAVNGPPEQKKLVLKKRVVQPSSTSAHTDGDEQISKPEGTISFFLPTVPQDALQEFEAKLEADLQTVGVTLVGILGVIIFWRGVWSLLDQLIGEDNVFGDVCCTLAGLAIVLYIRLSGLRLASFWPPN